MGSFLHRHCLKGRVTLNGTTTGCHLFIRPPSVLAVTAFIPVHFLFDSCPAPVLLSRRGRDERWLPLLSFLIHSVALRRFSDRIKNGRWNETRLLSLLKSRWKFTSAKTDAFTLDKETRCTPVLMTGSSREADYFSSAIWLRGTGLHSGAKSTTFPPWSCWDASVS